MASNDQGKAPSRIIGVLLAAGRGRRLGGAKQFHLVETATGQKPLAAASFDAIANACDAMVVVLGHRADEVAQMLAPRVFHRVDADPDSPMFQSVLAGLGAARDVDRLASVLLQPADHACVTPQTLSALRRAAASHPTAAILPEYHGQGGHPVLIPSPVIDKILKAESTGGLRQFWIEHPQHRVRLPVADASVVRDLDTIDD